MRRSRWWLGLSILSAARAAVAQDLPSEITVQGERAPVSEGYVLPAEVARRTAGTQGDPAKATQSLPGVGRGDIGGGDVVLWGSEPRESRIEVDGVEVPRLYHGSGVRSVLPASSMDNVRVQPGAFGPEQGRALGGRVDLESRWVDANAPRLFASADMLDASASASAPVGRAGAVGLAFRYGYVDRWLPRLIAPELRGLYRVPGYWDGRAEVAPRLSAGQRLRIVFLASSDRGQTQLLSQDPANNQRADELMHFGRLYAQYERHDGGETTTVTPFVGWDRSSQALVVGQDAANVDSTALRYGLKAQHRTRLSVTSVLGFGVDAAGTAAHVERQGSLAVPRREGDPLPFGTPPGSRTTSDDYRAHVLGVGVFVAIALQPLPTLRIEPSLRFEPTLLETTRVRPPVGDLPDAGSSRVALAVEPRVAVEQRLSRRARLFGAAGRYHQPPDVTDLSARFGNPSLGLASATHVLAGESLQLVSRTRVEVSAFAKWLDGLPVRANEAGLDIGETLLPRGKGRAFGAQLFVRQAELHGFSGWLSATLSRSERRDLNDSWRLSDFDAPLSIAVNVLQRAGAFRFGARARYSSGAPRTPVVGAYYDVASQRYQPLLGPLNQARLRDFFELDLRVDRGFDLGAETHAEVYVEALNVTARTNQEELAYSSDFRRVGSIGGLPPLALVGITVER